MTEHPITPEDIAAAEADGACEDALVWLRSAPRTWEEMGRYRADWVWWDGRYTRRFPTEALACLAGDEDGDVRFFVADHTSTPADVLVRLACDDDRFVREVVAFQSSTPMDVLVRLAGDDDGDVRQAAVYTIERRPKDESL